MAHFTRMSWAHSCKLSCTYGCSGWAGIVQQKLGSQRLKPEVIQSLMTLQTKPERVCDRDWRAGKWMQVGVCFFLQHGRSWKEPVAIIWSHPPLLQLDHHELCTQDDAQKFRHLQHWRPHCLSGQCLLVLIWAWQRKCSLLFRGSLLCFSVHPLLQCCHWAPLGGAWLHPPWLPMPSLLCAVLPGDTRVVEVPYEDQDLRFKIWV